MDEETIKTGEKLVKRDDKGRIVSGKLNPYGRPPGKTLKEYKAEKFRTMSDEEKEAWIKENKVSGDTQWKMAEGNPSNDVILSGELTSKIIRLNE